MRKKIVFLPYDFDTAIGINNEGALVFPYNLEDIDQLASGADVFNGQQSVLWKNMRAAFFNEIKAMYQELRSSGDLSYEKVEAVFAAHQAKWGEAIFNEDAWIKYLAPLVEDGSGAYLAMLQGSKAEQRKWWLYNRFRYMDSKYNAGDALSDVIQLRGYAKQDVSVTPYADIYAAVKYGSYLVQARAARNHAQTLPCPLDNVNDTEIYIYSASQIASVGDLSGLKVGYADFSMGTKLQSIKLGDSDANYSNGNLTELYLGNNVLLRTLDVRNCPNLGQGDMKSVDIAGCKNVEYVYFDGTTITGVDLPNGGILKILHLPGTITNLTIRNQPSIANLTIPSYANISTLWLETVSSAVDEKAILRAIPASSRVRIIGIRWECSGATEIDELMDILDTMRGLDESGNNMNTAQVSGTIHTSSLTGADIAEFNARYPYIDVVADHTTSYRTYADYDGTVIKTVSCVDGVPQEAAPTGLTRANSADGHYSYSFVGWSKSMNATAADADALDNVLADRTVYAAYAATVRKYTVTWKNSNGTVLRTDTNVAWGTTPSWGQAMPTYNGETAKGWTPTPGAITGNTIYTARYEEASDAPTATTASGAYGVEWNYGTSSSTKLTRAGLAASFADPSPATTVSGSGSSPFDTVAPWKDMKRYNVVNGSLVADTDPSFDAAAYDTVVYIPEFYYTAYKDTAAQKWMWAISPTAIEGFVKHPGSGKYIGRYHTSGDSAAVFTKSGVAPLANTSQTDFRTYSTAKGTGWRMLDLAAWSALQMLYLVEFADFDAQTVLGKGWNTGSVGTMGGTDSAAYHTVKATGAHNQYRWIEDPFSNVRDWIDGFMGSTSSVYAAARSSYAGGTSGLTSLGIKLPSSGYVKGFGYSNKAAWAFIPDTSGGGDGTYVSDYVNSSSSARPASVGGTYYGNADYGFFYVYANNAESVTGAVLGSRLLYDPA